MRAHVYSEGEADPSFLTDCKPKEPSGSVVLSRGMIIIQCKNDRCHCGRDCGQCRRHFLKSSVGLIVDSLKKWMIKINTSEQRYRPLYSTHSFSISVPEPYIIYNAIDTESFLCCKCQITRVFREISTFLKRFHFH